MNFQAGRRSTQPGARAADSAPTAPLVRLSGVSKRFAGTQAVDRAAFELAQGEFLTILGPSGSGKTTVLRMIAGFISPDEGEIYVGGQPVSQMPAHRRSIGMVFQRLALFPHMTAAQNVAYPLKMRRHDPKRIDERVESYLDLVQLHGLGGRRIHELSGGQQQRVAIARALVFEPQLLLLDEPLAALDKKLREDMQLEFRRIQQELGVTTINVTHDQREALVMSDRIVVMDHGQIQQTDTPVGAYQAPGNRFVAGFIGVTNFLEGTLQRLDPPAAEVSVGEVKLPGRCQEADASAGQAADGALRAEQIQIAGAGDALEGLETTVEGTVAEAIFEGDRLVYAVRCPALNDALLKVFQHNPAVERAHAPGEAVRLGWRARDLMVFPR
jgi:putative spermidine/putrescine transport system ATP-binding protein